MIYFYLALTSAADKDTGQVRFQKSSLSFSELSVHPQRIPCGMTIDAMSRTATPKLM